jgi:hypothetical protein
MFGLVFQSLEALYVLQSVPTVRMMKGRWQLFGGFGQVEEETLTRLEKK